MIEISPISNEIMLGLTQLQTGDISTKILEAKKETKDERRDLLADIVSLREQLDKVYAAFKNAGKDVNAFPAAHSVSNLGLDMVGSYTTLTSTEEVNACANSFSPYGPDFTGASTAVATVAGQYDGTDGTDTLKVYVTVGGTVAGGGSPNIELELRDSLDATLDTVQLDPSDPAGTEVVFDNGIKVSFSAGDLVADDYFEVAVDDSTGMSVDATKAFNGTRDDQPGFEDGVSVSAGTFTVNGETITVDADDSIKDVLVKICTSNAGVTAEFDDATETVVLTQQVSGSSSDIVLADDTSGFLAAVKLDGASSVAGDAPDQDDVIDNVAALSGITSGSFSINGKEISIDTSADTLNDVIDRINSSGAGVEAILENDRLTIQASEHMDELDLDDGDTNFFSAVNITDTTFESVRGTTSAAKKLLSFADDEVSKLMKQMENVFKAEYGDYVEDDAYNIKNSLLEALRFTFLKTQDEFLWNGATELKSGMGLDFEINLDDDLEDDDDENYFLFSYSHADFAKTMREDSSELFDFLTKKSSTGTALGFLPVMLETVSAIEKELKQAVYDPKGLFVQVEA